MNILPNHIKVARRACQLRDAQARSRNKRAVLKLSEVRITISTIELQELQLLREGQSGPMEDFFKRALMTGARFVFNSGNIPFGRIRAKRPKKD